MSQTKEKTITLQITVPDASLIDAQVAKALEDFGKQRAREIVSRTMTAEINRIVDAKVNESKDAWSAKSPIGKAVIKRVEERLEQEYAKLNTDQEQIIKSLSDKVKANVDYAKDAISKMIRREVCRVANEMGASRELKEAVLDRAAEEVRITYPLQMAQLIDTKQQELLCQRIKELEGQLDAARKENESLKTGGTQS